MFRRSPLDAPNDVLLMMINISGIFSTTDREELFPEKHFLIKIIYHCLNCRENVVTAGDTRATSKKKIRKMQSEIRSPRDRVVMTCLARGRGRKVTFVSVEVN